MEKTFFQEGNANICGLGEQPADSHSVHLKAFAVQLFQHNFSFKVTILMVKRVEVQRVYFAPQRGS